MSDSEPEPARPVKAKFKKGQKCIVPIEEDNEDGDTHIVFYAAQIERGEKRYDPETNEPDFHYHVHFIGFPHDRDEWFVEDQLQKYDAAIFGLTDPKKRKADALAEAATQQKLIKEIPLQLRLRMPAPLKKLILEDNEIVIKQGKALPLPRSNHAKPTISEILDEYKEAQCNEEGAHINEIEQVVDGLKSYFDFSLRQMLLYAPEVPLCDGVLVSGGSDDGNKPKPSDVYGAEHLNRLLVKLPELVSIPMMCMHGDAVHVVTLEGYLKSLMTMMVDNQDRLFTAIEDYVDNPHWIAPPVVSTPAPSVPKANKKSKSSAAASKDNNQNDNDDDDGQQQ